MNVIGKYFATCSSVIVAFGMKDTVFVALLNCVLCGGA